MAFSNYINVKDELEGFCKDNKLERTPTLIAVSKTVGIDEIFEAQCQGCVDFGENRPDDLVYKAKWIKNVKWHFIGNIQSRQLKKIMGAADHIHSLCNISHAAKINELAETFGKVQNVFIEVNVSGEKSKSGVISDDLNEFLGECKNFENMHIEGLMTMAPKTNPRSIKKAELPSPTETFSRLKKLGDNMGISTFSMGMSDDWKDAILAGSSYVRIGRAIFDEGYKEV